MQCFGDSLLGRFNPFQTGLCGFLRLGPRKTERSEVEKPADFFLLERFYEVFSVQLVLVCGVESLHGLFHEILNSLYLHLRQVCFIWLRFSSKASHQGENVCGIDVPFLSPVEHGEEEVVLDFSRTEPVQHTQISEELVVGDAPA